MPPNQSKNSDPLAGQSKTSEAHRGVGHLSVRNVAMSYGDRAVLRSVDLEFEPGSITAVLGPSGCGKTTLLRLIAGFLRPDGGEIRLDDTVLANGSTLVPPERRHIGIVAQEGALFPHLTVAENVGFGIRRAPDRDERVHEWLERVGLLAHATSRPNALSGGQQQRVALARALAARPQVVLLDEPFSSLDTHLRERVRGEVVDVLKAAGVTTILVTHDRDEALSITDRVAVMFNGAIAQVGSPVELYNSPTSVEVAGFVGELCILAGSCVGDRADTNVGNHPVHRLESSLDSQLPGVDSRSQSASSRLSDSRLSDSPSSIEPLSIEPVSNGLGLTVLGCRPEQLQVYPSDELSHGQFVGNGVIGVIERCRYLGPRLRLDIRLADGALVFTYVPGSTPSQVGSTVGVSLRGTVLELTNS
jgi:iron(III) transport system ATP-binding protein